MTIYQCPAACGELIEGQIDGINFLSSYTINCFSRVMVTAGQTTKTFQTKYPKLCAVIDLLAHANLIPKNWRAEITVKSDSKIPVGKGMGSSTADLSAGLVALSDYYRLDLTPAEIIAHCVQVEPTDHNAYVESAIMNHVTGEVFFQTSFTFEMSVLVLEPLKTVDTRQAMQKMGGNQVKERDKILKRLRNELVEAYKRADLAWLADIAWTSALLNETVLEKPLLHPLKKLTETNGVLGLNIAHTGSIIALWFDETKVRGDELKKYVRAIDTKGYYKQYHVFQTIPGGVRRKKGVIH